eukprot:8980352-Pyramimonas_sp.AAC.1
MTVFCLAPPWKPRELLGFSVPSGGGIGAAWGIFGAMIRRRVWLEPLGPTQRRHFQSAVFHGWSQPSRSCRLPAHPAAATRAVDPCHGPDNQALLSRPTRSPSDGRAARREGG